MKYLALFLLLGSFAFAATELTIKSDSVSLKGTENEKYDYDFQYYESQENWYYGNITTTYYYANEFDPEDFGCYEVYSVLDCSGVFWDYNGSNYNITLYITDDAGGVPDMGDIQWEAETEFKNQDLTTWEIYSYNYFAAGKTVWFVTMPDSIGGVVGQEDPGLGGEGYSWLGTDPGAMTQYTDCDFAMELTAGHR